MLNKVKKQKIGDEEFSFKMTNKSILKIDEKYGSYAKVIQGLMDGEQFHTNAIKLISCCCTDKNKNIKVDEDEKEKLSEEFTVDELLEKLTPEQLQFEMPDLATNLYLDYMGISTDNKEKAEKEEAEKN